MKKYQKWFLGLVWGMVVIQSIINITAKNDYKLLEAFEASESIPIDGKVTVGGSLGQETLSEKTKRNLLISLANKAGLESGYQIDTKEEDGIETMTLKKEGGLEGVWLRISSSSQSNYLTTEVAVEDIGEILAFKERLEAILKENGIQTESSFYIRGDFKKILDREEKDAMEGKLLNILKAETVLDYKDEYSDTIYAYSSLLSDYYERNGEKINIQMILNYNESSNNTQLYLAVPFYNESY
jgi:hypothetical protein